MSIVESPAVESVPTGSQITRSSFSFSTASSVSDIEGYTNTHNQLPAA